MPIIYENPRTPDCDIDSMFTDRWSPRAFLSDPIPRHQILTMFEAARWAPSCFNEQPWSFVYADSEADRRVFLDLLVEKNRLWAQNAPLLIFILARRHFSGGKRENRHAPFDAGAAWMSLALQARKLGLHAHAMAGFNAERAHEVLGVDKASHHIMAAVAVGRRDPEPVLPETLLEMERPNSRKPVSEFISKGFPVAFSTGTMNQQER